MSFVYFLDDSGNSSLFSKGEFWVLGGVVMPDDVWPHLSTGIREVRRTWGIDEANELKWAHIGQRIRELTYPERVADPKMPIAHLTTVDQVKAVADEMVGVVAAEQRLQVMGVVCHKRDALRISRGEGSKDATNERCYRDMFNDAIERYEYFLTTLANAAGAFGSVVIDHKSDKFDNAVRDVCFNLLSHGSNFTEVRHVIDGVMVAPSHLSVGLQASDFVVGGIQRWFEYRDDHYMHILQHNFHRDSWGRVVGAGLKRYPSVASSGGALTTPY